VVVAITDGKLDSYPLETGPEPDPTTDVLVTLSQHFAPTALRPEALEERRSREPVQLVDVGSSMRFREGHLPGAIWLSRAQVQACLQERSGAVVFTCETGQTARLAAMDHLEPGNPTAAWLEGGNTAWQAAGKPIETGDTGIEGEPIDAWLAASERPGDMTENVIAYLDWETQLMDQISTAGEAPYRNLIWP